MSEYIMVEFRVTDEDGETQYITRSSSIAVLMRIGPIEDRDDVVVWRENLFIALRTVAMAAHLFYTQEGSL